MLQQIGVALLEYLHQFHHSGIARHNAGFKYRRSAQWQQPHHGPDFQPHGIAIREMEQIVEESVLTIPHFIVVLANSIHGVGDPEEMFQEPKRNVLVYGVVLASE